MVTEPVPDLKAATVAALEALKVMLVAQGAEAVKALAEASADAGRRGAEVLADIAAVGQQMMTGAIDERTARLAVDNYLEALRLQGLGLVTLAQVEAYKRGERLLARLGTMVVAFLDVALSVAVPGAVRLVEGIVDRVAGPRKGDA